jgi:SAM-dependent methyltransferase
MGLGRQFLRDLMRLKQTGALEGAHSVCEIGDQQLSDSLISSPDLTNAFRLFGCTDPPAFQTVGPERFTDYAPSSQPFWRALGFTRTAIDVTGDALFLDLNADHVPRKLRGAFDLVVNAGTTEHVANQKNAFAVIHDLCRRGGVIYHEVPAGGFIDHGLFIYHPNFFRRLIEYNRYECLFLDFWSHGQAPMPDYLRGELVRDDFVTECALRVAVRKVRDADFVCPLDARGGYRGYRPGIASLWSKLRVRLRKRRAVASR